MTLISLISLIFNDLKALGLSQELLGIFDPEWICEYIEVGNQVTVEDILKSLETDVSDDHEQSKLH